MFRLLKLINETPFFSNSSPVAKKVEAKLKEKFDSVKRTFIQTLYLVLLSKIVEKFQLFTPYKKIGLKKWTYYASFTKVTVKDNKNFN